jgi:hypothetical protein
MARSGRPYRLSLRDCARARNAARPRQRHEHMTATGPRADTETATGTTWILAKTLGGKWEEMSNMFASLRYAVPALVLAMVLGSAPGQSQTVVIGERAMPAPIVEVVPAARTGYAWVPGHWVWRGGRWFWVKGHHVQGAAIVPMPAPIAEVVTVRPSPRHVWVRGHHAWVGGKWVWVPGVWVR